MKQMNFDFFPSAYSSVSCLHGRIPELYIAASWAFVVLFTRGGGGAQREVIGILAATITCAQSANGTKEADKSSG